MSVVTQPKQSPDAPKSQAILLQSLRPGQLAEVVSLGGLPDEVARLAEMGLRTGIVVSVSRGGITCIVQLLNGSRLCVRPSRDLMIFVTPV